MTPNTGYMMKHWYVILEFCPIDTVLGSSHMLILTWQWHEVTHGQTDRLFLGNIIIDWKIPRWRIILRFQNHFIPYMLCFAERAVHCLLNLALMQFWVLCQKIDTIFVFLIVFQCLCNPLFSAVVSDFG